MFLDTMSFEEIRLEYDRDKEVVANKILLVGKQYNKYMRQYKVSKFDKYVEYTSLRKNKWIIHYYTEGEKPQLTFTSWCHFLTEKSYAVILAIPLEDKLVYYTGHFFTRYVERMKLEANIPSQEVIKTFINENAKVATDYFDQVAPQQWQAFYQYKEGVGLGFEHRNLRLMEVRTFITNAMLGKNQIEKSEMLEDRFKIEVLRKGPGEE